VWIFPKGHLRPGESHAAAALREAGEEGGIAGIVIGLVGPALTFRSGEEVVTVEYYLIHLTTEVPSPEGRSKQWLTPADALDELTFEDARNLVRAALPEMSARAPDTADDKFIELLLHEYDHLGESLLANEEGGEKRVSFFLTLCGGVSAAIGFVVGEDATLLLTERFLIAVSLLTLFVLGYVTFVRVVVRNAASDRYKNQLARIRQRFLKGDVDPRIDFLPFHPYTLVRRKPRESWWRVGKGGWAETMALVEALIGGGLIAFVSWTLVESLDNAVSLFGVVALGIVVGCFVWRGLLQRGDALYNQELNHQRDGSVPLRGDAGTLIV
jgi:ADP-ribose pyrophosphatase YjhB (NUDIX family)